MIIDSSGNIIHANWVDGIMSDVCKIKYNTGDVYEGEF